MTVVKLQSIFIGDLFNALPYLFYFRPPNMDYFFIEIINIDKTIKNFSDEDIVADYFLNYYKVNY